MGSFYFEERLVFVFIIHLPDEKIHPGLREEISSAGLHFTAKKFEKMAWLTK